MPEINIANESGRDAVVNLESVTVPAKVRWVDRQSRQASSTKLLKSTVSNDLASLKEQLDGVENISAALIGSDPEVDIEIVGSKLANTSRAYIDSGRKLVHKVVQWEIVKNVDGSERDRRLRDQAPQNIRSEVPLKWSGIMVDRNEAVRKFVFAAKTQLTHINGLTYDFLYAMAKDLESKNCLMVLGAGPKNNQPLIMRRGSVPYRGFLEGRTQGNKYCLILHLSNLELKKPIQESEAS